jgi:hypothetical protein
MTVKIAKQLKASGLSSPAQSDQRLYELDPPMKNYDGDEEYRHVVVSATVVRGSGPETYIFGARKVDNVFAIADWAELPGSYQGGLSHERALANAGYVVIP